jgi:hypothetical protein
MLIVSGIHGDEPGSMSAADLYANLRLEQGNLIIIPRANLKSVVMFQRGPDGDMNRIFTDNIPDNEMGKVAGVLLSYMQKADLFIHLHDGHGFYNPAHIDPRRNPRRLGQSIIIDMDVFVCGDEKTLELGNTARGIIERVNARITDKKHHLLLLDTRTGTSKPHFQGMETTATWYALRNFCLPSFGIEISKDINSVEQKALYHRYIRNEFMRTFDISPEYPPVFLPPPVLESALITINGRSMTVKDGDTINVKKGDMVSVRHIESNYRRGVTCDILGTEGLNNIGTESPIIFSTKIVFRQDSKKFAEVSLNIDSAKPDMTAKPSLTDGYIFIVSVDNKQVAVTNGETLKLPQGAKLRLHRLELNSGNTNLPINLRGWIPEPVRKGLAPNDGDDRGYDIFVHDREMMKRHSLRGEGRIYPITVDANDTEVARIYLEIVR